MATGSGSRSVKAAKGRTGGRQSVIYRDTRGKTFSATVLSAGAGANELNLKLTSKGGALRYVTDVPKATAKKQTGRWY